MFNGYMAKWFIFYLIFSLFLLLKASSSTGQVAGKSTSSSVEVSLSIGEYRFNLFGYSSPGALVTFSGMGIYDQTYADEAGYFQFKNRFSPFSPREACLTARDQLGRLTTPVCLPPFPTNYNMTIGPVLMPPTLSLNKNDYWVGDEVILTGQTIPKSQVNLSMFTKSESQNPKSETITKIKNSSAQNKNVLNFMVIKPVEAFSFPQLETAADEEGNFSLALPSSKSETFRLFTQTNYQKERSPQSLKLTVKILPWWMVIIQFLLLVFALLKLHLLEILILGEIIGLIIYFIRRYLHPHPLAIVRRNSLTLVKT